MTQINFNFGHPSADGVAVLAGELVHVVPTGRFRVGKRIVVRDSFDVRLSEDGTATVDVTPTDSTFAYEVTVGESPDAWRFVRCVSVPDSKTAVEFADLPDVDSATLGPVDNNGSMVVFDMADSLEAAEALSSQYPTHLVFYPESETAARATMLLSDILDARAVAADNADASSAAASQARSDASVAASQVAASTADAQNIADVKAQAVADADTVSDTVTVISAKQTEVESKAADAVDAIDATVKQVQAKAADAAGSVGKAEDISSGDGDAGVGSGSSEE